MPPNDPNRHFHDLGRKQRVEETLFTLDPWFKHERVPQMYQAVGVGTLLMGGLALVWYFGTPGAGITGSAPTTLLPSFVGLVIIVCFVSVASMLFRLGRREQRLLSEGIALAGEITDVEVYRYRGQAYLKISYRFVSLNRTKVYASVQLLLLPDTPRPKIGMACGVLYLNDKHFRMM